MNNQDKSELVLAFAIMAAILFGFVELALFIASAWVMTILLSNFFRITRRR